MVSVNGSMVPPSGRGARSGNDQSGQQQNGEPGGVVFLMGSKVEDTGPKCVNESATGVKMCQWDIGARILKKDLGNVCLVHVIRAVDDIGTSCKDVEGEDAKSKRVCESQVFSYYLFEWQEASDVSFAGTEAYTMHYIGCGNSRTRNGTIYLLGTKTPGYKRVTDQLKKFKISKNPDNKPDGNVIQRDDAVRAGMGTANTIPGDIRTHAWQAAMMPKEHRVGDLMSLLGDIQTASLGKIELECSLNWACCEEAKKEGPKKDEPKKEGPGKDGPRKGEPRKEEPRKQEPRKEEPWKEGQGSVAHVQVVSNPSVTAYW